MDYESCKILLNWIENEWKKEVDNPESIWHMNGKENIIERRYKELKQGRVGYLEKAISKTL